MYTVVRTITLRDADAAGVLFFARYLSLAHDAYEEMMASRGIRFGDMLHAGTYILPVIRTGCEYRVPLKIGDAVEIRVAIAEIRRRSYTVAYEMIAPDGRLAAKCHTTHVAVDKTSRKSIPLPDELAAALRAEAHGAKPATTRDGRHG
ncbi:MAG TPA: thioesterase family protein [Candidatus Hydrogenedentes bacterium]|nr:thioesterase family protein [Candidatus Hydrogenedentota bacterium]HPC17639.1 thioesterase family protein [Candidatus Hydrogenedentota bacterium]HRT21495.1 thioesterase family protein [Candidatus Hydrogenedentota bacterium]HRT66199.1 thioesterase family protein [Candidatus Hydrogenedentota bacterium]